MIALLLIAFLVVGTIKVAKEVTTGLVGGSVDTKFQEKLKGVAMMCVHLVTGGLTKGLAKVGMVMRAKERYHNSAFGKAMEKRAEIAETINRWAGRKN